MTWTLQHQPSARFPRNPLALVVAQLKFRPILRVPPRIAEYQDRIRARFPLFEVRKVREIGFDPLQARVESREHEQFLFRTEKGDVTVSLIADALGIETNAYGHHTEFIQDVGLAVDALTSLFTPVATTRLGLRYVNDIKLPEIAADLGRPVEWDDVVTNQLSTMSSQLTLQSTTYLVEVTSPMAQGQLTLRQGLLQASPPPAQPVHRIDIDRYFDGRFEPAKIGEMLTAFSDDCYSLFSALTGPALQEWMSAGVAAASTVGSN